MNAPTETVTAKDRLRLAVMRYGAAMRSYGRAMQGDGSLVEMGRIVDERFVSVCQAIEALPE